MAETERKEWVDLIQKVLVRMISIRGEMYAQITGDNETYVRVCDDLRIMIEHIQAADGERFLRAADELVDAERRRLEEFGI